MSTSHVWKFFRAGGFDQVRLDSGEDLVHLDELDQKLWVALACPATGVEFDTKTLALIDTDKDGRVRAPEIIAATRWACGCLKNPSDLLQGSLSLPLSAINDATPEGRQLLSSARQILANLGKKDATAITADDTADPARIFATWNLNGDGIVPAEATEDAALRAVIADIIACLGAETDRSGKPGVSQARADLFFADAAAYSDWWKKSEGDSAILPVGEATVGASAAVKAVKAKVDDYFARCRLAEFDARAVNALNREEKDYLALAPKDLSLTHAEIAALPLAQIGARQPLSFTQGVNPAWADALARLARDAVQPLLGEKTSLTEADWTLLLARLGPFECWSAGKAGVSVEKLGLPRVREILAGQSRESLTALIAQDKALEAEANAIVAVDKLVRLHRDLYKLVNNFVCFRDFYERQDKAIFQAGTLYLDQRSCELCLAVEDAGRHASMAGLAGAYLAYCDCTRKATGEKRQIVAAFTDGDSDNLMAGRNGIFYDRKGQDWDATITRIVDNPISLRQAFWAPYKKLVRMIEEQVAKRAAAAEAASTARLEGAASALATADQKKAPEPKKLDTGTVAALGVGIGAIGTFLATVFAKAVDLAPWQVALVLAGLVLAISGPSLLIAWLKLRKRNLGPILDANGWAVNAKARINVPFGASLTQVAALPEGAESDLFDPFADKKSPWRSILVALLLLFLAGYIANKTGKLNEWSRGAIGAKVETTNTPSMNLPSATNAPAGK